MSGLIPGPRLPSPVQAALFYQWPLAFVGRCERRYGKVFALNVPPFGKLVYVSDPDALIELFAQDGLTAHAGEVVRPAFTPVVGTESLLVLDGERHRAERRLLAPAFSADTLGGWEPAIRRAVEREVESWRGGRVVAMLPAMRRVTFAVTADVVLGVREEGLRRTLEAQLAPVTRIPTSVAVPELRKNWGRFSPWARFLRARAALDRTLYQIISERRGRRDVSHDVLGVLLAARDQHGRALSDQHIRDELVTLLFAGHDATATVLAWGLERLARHPEPQRRIRDGDEALLAATAAETLRVRPVIKEVGRVLSAPVELGGYHVPAGTTVFGGIYLVQLDPDNHPDPLRFDPTRLVGKRSRRTWLPFGGGRRRCIGAGLVELELRTVIKVVTDRFELTPASPTPERPRMRGATLIPAKGARVRIRAIPAQPGAETSRPRGPASSAATRCPARTGVAALNHAPPEQPQ